MTTHIEDKIIFGKTINTILIADQKPAKAAFFDMLGQLMALLVIYILRMLSIANYCRCFP